MAENNWSQAVADWEVIITRFGNKTPANVYHKLILAYRRLGHIRQAEAIAKQGAKLYPNDSNLHIQQALLAMDQAKWAIAAKHWEKVLGKLKARAPVAAWVNLSKSQRRMGKLDAVDATISQILKKHPENLDLLVESARTATEKKDWAEALRRWQTVNRFSNGGSDEALSAKWQAKFSISILRRLIKLDYYQSEIESYIKSRAKRQAEPKIAIYTAISGGYDTLRLPEKLDSRLDYILFTDTPIVNTGIYDIRPMPFISADATRTARFVKTHPHQLLADYDMAIWVDANIMITGDIFPFVQEFIKSKKKIAAIPHPQRQTLQEELKACIEKAKDEKSTMIAQVEKYYRFGFETSELIESNFMIFDLSKKQTREFLNTWWSEIDQNSRRDQLSLNYSLHKHKIKWHRLTKFPYSVRTVDSFVLTPHGSSVETLAKEMISTIGNRLKDPFSGVEYSKVKKQRVEEQKKRQIDVVVCVHNALDDVKLCLESVRINRKSSNQRLIIIDDGSDIPTADYLKEFANKYSDWTKIIRNKSASGYARAANQGLRASTGELVILLNSDTIVTKDWAEKMADAVFSSPGAGIVGPLSSAASHQSIPEHRSSNNQTAINKLPKGLTPEDINRSCEQWTVGNIIPRVPLVHGFCFGISRDTINKIGFFDTKNFPNGYGEENDYCFRAVDAGVGLVLAAHTYIFHAKSKSYSNAKRIKLMKQGNEKLRELYGKERITRAIVTMQKHPMLMTMRAQAKKFYRARLIKTSSL